MQVNNQPGLTNLSTPAVAVPPQRPTPPAAPVETARAVSPPDKDTKSGENEAAVEQEDKRPSRPGRLLDIRV